MMPAGDAHKRVSDDVQGAVRLQERVTAVTGVLGKPIPRRHEMNPMPEKAAQVADPFSKTFSGHIRIVDGLEEQRVSALHASVLVMPMPARHPHVCMLSEEARQRMAHARVGPVSPEVQRAAAADRQLSNPLTEEAVVHVVTPERARHPVDPAAAVPRSPQRPESEDIGSHQVDSSEGSAQKMV
jgi:hypothetical protein